MQRQINELVNNLKDKSDEEIGNVLGLIVLQIYKSKNKHRSVNQYVLEQVYKAFNKPAKKVYNKLQQEYYCK